MKLGYSDPDPTPDSIASIARSLFDVWNRPSYKIDRSPAEVERVEPVRKVREFADGLPSLERRRFFQLVGDMFTAGVVAGVAHAEGMTDVDGPISRYLARVGEEPPVSDGSPPVSGYRG